MEHISGFVSLLLPPAAYRSYAFTHMDHARLFRDTESFDDANKKEYKHLNVLCEEIPLGVTFSTVFLFQYIFSLDPKNAILHHHIHATVVFQ